MKLLVFFIGVVFSVVGQTVLGVTGLPILRLALGTILISLAGVLWGKVYEL